jgi:hypothetical protein
MRDDRGDIIYSNPLSSPSDIVGFRMEGEGKASFPEGRLRLESAKGPEEGQAANIVLWCPEDFPDGISVSWDFYPLAEPGLCILFFAARGRGGQDLFDPSLSPRNGPYEQYHHGDIDALHVSYFRRRYPEERAFRLCNLRKSYGFRLVAQGSDPIPDAADAAPPYRMELRKSGPLVTFSIGWRAEAIRIFEWSDDGRDGGKALGGGKIGFRQMAPMVAEYANFEVRVNGPFFPA